MIFEGEEKELFDRIIRAWRARPDASEGLTLKQIANITLGLGSDTNSALVGRTIAVFSEYFQPPPGNGYKVRVRWTQIAQDHPELFSGESSRSSGIANPFAEMQHALDDEIKAVRKHGESLELHGVIVRGIGQVSEGSFWYEASVELPREDAEFPMPEGVAIRLRWPKSLRIFPADAKLLTYDSLNSLIIFETARPLFEGQLKNPFKILPCLEELLFALKSRLEKIRDNQGSLVSNLFSRDPRREQINVPIKVFDCDLDEPQLHAVTACLSHDITFLWGPPGTGKTFTLGRLMASAALAGKRVIAAAISNVAVDQMAKSVVASLNAAGDLGRELLDSGKVLRFGHPRLPEVTNEPRLFPNKAQIQAIRKELHAAQQRHKEIPESDRERRAASQKAINELRSQLRDLTKRVISESSIVLTTAVQTCIEEAISDSQFHIAVIDEASMMPLPYLIAVAALSRQQLVICGDFRQLGPIALAQTDAAFKWLRKDAFEHAGIGEDLTHAGLVMLAIQRRMHEGICRLINAPFYKGRLKTAAGDCGCTSLEPRPGEPAVLLSILPEDGSEVVMTEDGSRVNKFSAELAAKIALRYFRDNPAFEIGIIAPYRAHITRIKRELKRYGLTRKDLEQIKCGTVHAFQGGESDIIIWDLVDTRVHKLGRLYWDKPGERLVNVAISRARGKLVIIGDPDAFFQAPGAEKIGRFKAVLSAHFPPYSDRCVDLSQVTTALRLNEIVSPS